MKLLIKLILIGAFLLAVYIGGYWLYARSDYVTSNSFFGKNLVVYEDSTLSNMCFTVFRPLISLQSWMDDSTVFNAKENIDTVKNSIEDFQNVLEEQSESAKEIWKPVAESLEQSVDDLEKQRQQHKKKADGEE